MKKESPVHARHFSSLIRGSPPPSHLAPSTVAAPVSRRWTRVDLLMLLMALIWGVNFAVIKIALRVFHPLSFNAIRFFLASTLLTLVVWRQAGIRRWRVIERRDLRHLIGLGILANCCYQIAFIHGINLTLAGNAALILGATPVLTTLLSAWRGHEQLGPRSILGVAASFLGVTLIVVSTHQTISFNGTLIGDLLILSCTVLWSIYTVGLQPLIHKYGYMECTRLAMIAGTVPLIALSIPSLLRQPWSRVDLTAWGALLFSAAGAIALCYSIWTYGVRQLGNTRTAAYANLTMPFALLVAWIILDERPGPGQLGGLLAILGGLYMTRTDWRNKLPADMAT
ncbi:MAG: DMT family transporter [Acidobacteria bacterium]|nr:MAG: DMT family transporter [Acidobacteriota bacterium]